MTIKQVAAQTGVSIDNLRYYERVGLLPPIPRNDAGMRASTMNARYGGSSV